jgi:hypothetical protein
MARKRPTVAPAEGLLTEAVLTMSALCRTAAHDPKQISGPLATRRTAEVSPDRSAFVQSSRRRIAASASKA